jgi:hypothetical protein
MQEWYIYFVTDHGFEDLVWYSEDDIVTKTEALNKFHKLNKDYPMRLYTIYRPANKQFLVEEYTPSVKQTLAANNSGGKKE